MTSCCNHKFSLCMLQGADKTFTLSDSTDADFSTASEITFDLWKGNTNELSYSLTGGQITQPNDHQVTFTIPNTDSTGLTKGNLKAEVWVTFADGSRVGAIGKFSVEDTRKHD